MSNGSLPTTHNALSAPKAPSSPSAPSSPDESGTGEAGRGEDFLAKTARLAELAADHDLDTLVLRDPAALTWLLEARVHVPQTLDTACLDVCVDAGSGTVTVYTNAIEAPRLADIELAGLPVQWQVNPWWADRLAALPRGPRVGTDRPYADCRDLAAPLVALRRTLTTRQQRLIAEVAQDTAQAATAAAHRLDPAMTETAAAGALAEELLSRGLDPIVLFAAGQEHVDRHRHPLPTPAVLGDRVMLVCCARRHGLVASVTRLISFPQVGPGFDASSYDDLLQVEAAFLEATQPGARLGDAFAAGIAAYPRHGFDADEWHRHHQGGLSGFQPREFPATAASDVVLAPGMVVAWNPSGRGVKVEDTALVTDDGLDLLVHDDAWPTRMIDGRRRPDVLRR